MNKAQDKKERQAKAINSFKQMRKHAKKNGFMNNDEINTEIEFARKTLKYLTCNF